MATRKFDVNHGIKALKIKNATALIVSVDGTLADTTHQQMEDMNTGSYRTTIVARRAVDRVQINDDVAKRLKSYLANKYSILYLTSRPKDLREETEEWLKRNELWGPKCFVLMRENFDSRDKYRTLKKAVTFARDCIGFAYEGDINMLKYYKELGIAAQHIGE